MNKNMLDKLKDCYDNNQNIISYLKEISGRQYNTVEDIMIAYDFQAGIDTELYEKNTKDYKDYHIAIANIIKSFLPNESKEVSKIMEAGIGEGTTMGPVSELIGKTNLIDKYGFDISWSRLKYAEKFLHNFSGNKVNLFLGNMFNIPVQDNSIDIIYTIHAIEPNGGKEEEILKELYRAASKYLILFEPAYEFANDVSKERMLQHGYVTNLYETAKHCGYKVIRYDLLGFSLNELNPTGVMVIEKNIEETSKDVFICPISKNKLHQVDNVMYCNNSMLMYPIMAGIPCLLEDHALVATKFNNFI